MSQMYITVPSKPKLVNKKENSATFEIDNLYPGYGHTLGNSLRRIILSSLPGAAITRIKIKGVEHEFSTIEGMKEDVLALILHLKKVRFKMLTDEAQTVRLKVKGPKLVKAEDLELPGQLELLNPDEYITELTGNGELELEFVVEKGIGFLPKEVLQKDRVEIGTIIPDASFSPIRRVNYEVENMRVEDRTDYNRLRIFIETDGSISPEEALTESIKIMIKQLQAIVDLQEEAEEKPEEEEKKEKSADDTEIIKTLVSELNLSSRTENALSEAGIRTVGGLIRKTEEDILALPGLGQKGLKEIKEALNKLGVGLRE